MLAIDRRTIAVQLPRRVVLLRHDTHEVIWEHSLRSQSLLLPGLRLHPCGSVILAGTMLEVHWLDLGSGSLLHVQKGRALRGMAIAPDRATCAAVQMGRRKILVWYPSDSEQATEVEIPGGMWDAVAFSLDSRHLFLAAMDSNLVRLNARTREIERSFATGQWTIRVGVAAQDEVVVLGGASSLKALDADTGRELWSHKVRSGPAFDFTPDREHLITISQGDWLTLKARSGREVARWPAGPSCDMAWSLSVSPDGMAVTFDDLGRLVTTELPPLPV